MIFDIDLREIDKLEKKFRKAPRIYGRAMAVMVNDMAFDMRNDDVPDAIDDLMIVRNKRFVRARIRVKKARARSNISQIVSEVGSVADRPRFTGWKEQETGKRTAKTRTMGLGARRGSRKRRAAPSARMRPGRHPGPRDLGIKGSRTKSKLGQAKAMLVWTRREGFRKPFRIYRHDRISDGLVQWRGGRLIRLQYFKRKQEAQPKRAQWMTLARRNYERRVNVIGMWSKAIARVSNWK